MGPSINVLFIVLDFFKKKWFSYIALIMCMCVYAPGGERPEALVPLELELEAVCEPLWKLNSGVYSSGS